MKVPDRDTVWTQAGSGTLDVGKPVTLTGGIEGVATVRPRALRRVLGEVTFIQVVRDEREALMGRIRNQLDHEADRYGIQVVDVRIRRADLPEPGESPGAGDHIAKARSLRAELEAAARTDPMLRERLAAAQRAFDHAQVGGDRIGALVQAGADPRFQASRDLGRFLLEGMARGSMTYDVDGRRERLLAVIKRAVRMLNRKGDVQDLWDE